MQKVNFCDNTNLHILTLCNLDILYVLYWYINYKNDTAPVWAVFQVSVIQTHNIVSRTF